MFSAIRYLLFSTLLATVLAAALMVSGAGHRAGDMVVEHCPDQPGLDRIAAPAEAQRRPRYVAPLHRHELAH